MPSWHRRSIASTIGLLNMNWVQMKCTKGENASARTSRVPALFHPNRTAMTYFKYFLTNTFSKKKTGPFSLSENIPSHIDGLANIISYMAVGGTGSIPCSRETFKTTLALKYELVRHWGFNHELLRISRAEIHQICRTK